MGPRLYSLFILCSFLNCKGQQPYGTELLKLEKEIPMPNVKGRIDHLAFNLKDKLLYVAALGNNSVEVVDLDKGAVLKSIKGVEEPQGIAYLSGLNEIVVASGANGDCIFYNAVTFEKVATIHLGGDADNIRYDTAEKKLYVGYGNGGIAMIDSRAHKKIGNVKLPAHPESFQLDRKNNKLYVNLPDDHSVAVIDVKRFTIADIWKIAKCESNFPMTLDTANNLVFIGFRHPATLVGYNALTGHQVSTNELVDDVDDIFYDPVKLQLIASGGGGSINIFKRENDKTYKKVADIPTREGARTSLLIPSLQTFILAQRASGGKAAALAVYIIKD